MSADVLHSSPVSYCLCLIAFKPLPISRFNRLTHNSAQPITPNAVSVRPIEIRESKALIVGNGHSVKFLD